MCKGPTAVIRRHIQRLASHLSDADATDRELLERFVAQRDEAAFEAVFRRHAAMVLAVARRMLGNAQDAEDVCQAAFLVLAKKAARQRWEPSVASWLYRTAYLLALKARGTAARRARRESKAAARGRGDAAASLEEISGQELLAVLDTELLALPERLRAPLVLCLLQGATRDEAAQRLGCPQSTLNNRLKRGREKLQAALLRRGLGLSALLAGLVLSQETAHAAIAGLGRQTAAAAVTLAAGQSVGGFIALPVSQLVGGVARLLPLSGLKAVLAIFLAGGLLTTGGFVAYRAADHRGAAAPTLAEPAPSAEQQSRLSQPPPARVADVARHHTVEEGDRRGDAAPQQVPMHAGAGDRERMHVTAPTCDVTWIVLHVDRAGNARVTITIGRVRCTDDRWPPAHLELNAVGRAPRRRPRAGSTEDASTSGWSTTWTWRATPRAAARPSAGTCNCGEWPS